jgi:hypothetical protein
MVEAPRISAYHHDDPADDDDEEDEETRDRSQRVVHFVVTNAFYPILNLEDYSTQEKESCWYSKSEKRAMEAERQRLVNRIADGKPCEEDMTYRGLDTWTSTGSLELDQKLDGIVAAVLEQQDRCWRRLRGQSHPQHHGDDAASAATALAEEIAAEIASRSMAVTSRCREQALKQARIDEQDLNEQEEFPDGISWYRPMKVGQRRRYRRQKLQEEEQPEYHGETARLRGVGIKSSTHHHRDGFAGRRRRRFLSMNRRCML